MYSDPFDLLELDRATATDADVRRAYAEKLKRTRPEDDRAGFMALRAAFEAARNQVRWRHDDAEYEQDHSPPDAYGQSSAEAAAREGGTEPAHDPILPYEEGDSETGEPFPDEDYEDDQEDDDEDDGYVENPGFSEDEVAAWRPVKAALDRLTDVLTATGQPPSVKAVLDVIDHDDVSSIDQYRAMQDQVQQLLCDRTNAFDQASLMRLPDWLSLEVFDALDGYYGWTRARTTNKYFQGLNDWLVRVRQALELKAAPARTRNQAALDEVTSGLFGEKPAAPDGPDRTRGGSMIWLWVGAGILLSQVVRFVSGMGGG